MLRRQFFTRVAGLMALLGMGGVASAISVRKTIRIDRDRINRNIPPADSFRTFPPSFSGNVLNWAPPTYSPPEFVFKNNVIN